MKGMLFNDYENLNIPIFGKNLIITILEKSQKIKTVITMIHTVNKNVKRIMLRE